MRISDWSSDVCSSDLACLPNSACRKKKATASSWPRARTGSKMRAMGRTRQRMPPNEPIRRCILSGERDERGRLIRLALSPDGLVLPDAAARAPGRGAWLAPDRAALENAISKHKLKGALSRAFKTGDIGWPDDLPDRIANALQRQVLDRLGLEARGGTPLTGSDRNSDEIPAGRARVLLPAADLPEGGRRQRAGRSV